MVKNEKGITLIELLASLSILSIIILLLGSVLLFGQKQSIYQANEIDSQSNVGLALKTISKEIRKGSVVNITSDSTTGGNILTIDGSSYKLENSTITKNGQALFNNIKAFNLSNFTVTNPQKSKITISITSVSKNNLPPISLSTTIYIRN